jgi:HD-GYP domain-containing protein (c-di-GMP phosphodiesterase class II)
MSRRIEKRPLPVARRGRMVYRAAPRFDPRRLATSAREMIQFKRPLVSIGFWFEGVRRALARARDLPWLRVLAVAFWAITTVRLVSSSSGAGLHLGSLSAWVIPAAGFLLGVLCWGLLWVRGPIDHFLGAVVVGVALPVLYLSVAGNVQSGDLVSVYIVLAVFTVALLPLRVAMAVGLLGALAAAVPLVAGWSTLYERSLLVLVCVIGLIVYAQTRMLGNFAIEKREAQTRERQIEQSFMTTLGAVSSMFYGKDRFAESHSRATAMLAVAVGQRLGMKGRTLRQFEYAALLHDVGKAGLPAALLNKPGPLTTEELALVHEHPVVAERILSRVPSLRPICPIVRAQYERWNGSGFPDGLAGESIPLGGRIIHVCAAFHAMSSERSYRPALSADQAIRELRNQAGSQFDPRVVEALIAIVQPSEPRPLLQRIQDRELVADPPGRETAEQQICRLTAEVASNLLLHDQARVYLVSSDRRHLVPAHVNPPHSAQAPGASLDGRIVLPGEGPAGQVFQSRRAVVIGDAEPGLLGIEGTAKKVSAVAVPVMVGSDIIGVIEVVKLGPNQYSKNDTKLLKILANQMALSVANARMIDRMVA